jgi:iron complex outermembrane receptor protein
MTPWRLVAASAIAVGALRGAVHAQTACGSTGSAQAVRATAYAPPLDRPVTLHARGVSLREAFDRLAATARVRLSYASDLVSLDQRVCLAFRDVALGAALTELLQGTALEPVAAGGDLVVLAPVRISAPPARLSLVRPPASVLDRIVVTGSAAGTSERSQTFALSVLRGEELARRGATTLAEALSGSVPGIWMWAQSPARIGAHYGSIRGASSFGVSSPKIYIDGVEVANPLVLTDISSDAVERVEVIRGPQGAALYGSDAISGVINVVLRHDGVGPAGDRLQLRTGAGVSGSAFVPNGVLAQDHGFSWRAGSGTRSAGLAMNLSSLGEFVPGGYTRRRTANADLRLIGSHTSLTMSGRFLAERTGIPQGIRLTSPQAPSVPLIAAPTRPFASERWRGAFSPDTFAPPPIAFDTTAPQAVDQYTLGATAAAMPDARWTHTAVVGLDGYRLANVAVEGGPLPTPADSALLAARGRSHRLSVRLSSVARLGSDDSRAGTITLSADHSRLREVTATAEMRRHVGSGPGPGPGAFTSTVEAQTSTLLRMTSGVTAQAEVALRHAFFLTGGLRLERASGFTSDAQVSALPLLGAAFVLGNGTTTLKLRSAYGKGIRPARSTLRATGWTLWQAHAFQDLSPEEQVGVEVGADLLFGRVGVLRLTRFDQLASGLIQPVAVADPRSAGPGGRSRTAYELQNVGEISNRGWELEGSTGWRGLTLGAALAYVDSRVQRTAAGYTGDLRSGDRMLEVPARTASVSASWLGRNWTTTWTVTRASDWVNYDRVALNAAALDPSHSSRDLLGATLRSYWREYDGVTRVNATATRHLTRGLTLVLTGDNLLGYQEGEPDNVTVLPGRTLTAGVRVTF